MSRIGFWGVIGGGISVMFALIVILMISGILPYLFNWQQIQDMNVDSALVVIAEADGKLPGDLITHNLYPDGNNTRDVGRSTGWYNEGYFYDGNFNRISVTTHADIGNLTVGNNTTIAGDLTINVSNPVKVGGAACAATARGIYVAGNYAYVVSDSTGDDIEVFDISDPTAPTKVGGAACASNANGIYVAGNYAYVVSDSTGDDIEIFDISDPTAPTKTGGAACADSARGIYVAGNYAYVVSHATGDDIEVFDISDPTAPTKVGGAACAATARGIYAAGNYAYVVSSATGDDIEIFDISDPTAPTKTGGAACASNANGIYVAGNYAYVVSDSTGDDIEIFDISDPTAPTKVGGANCDDSALGVYVSGNYAYVLSYVAGDDIEVFDISDPTAPTKVGGANCDDSALGVYVSGNYAYVASSSTGDDLEIFDIGGFNAATAQIGALKAGSLQVTDNAQVGNDLYVRHGIITGSGGIYAQGDSAFDGDVWIGGNSTDALYVVGNVSADGFNEFCVVYQGNAIEALKGIEATSEDTWAEVDHSTLPEGVRVTWQETRWVRIADGEVMPKNFDAGNQTGNILYKNQSITIEGRSLSRTVQVNTKALLELIARVEELEARR